MRFKWSAFYVILLALLYFHCYLLTVFLSLLSPSLKGLVMNKMKQSHTLTHICCVDEKCVVSFPAIAWDSSKVRFSLWKTVRTHWRKRCNVKCMISPGDWFFFLSWYCSRFYFCFIFFLLSLSLYFLFFLCRQSLAAYIFLCDIWALANTRSEKLHIQQFCVCVCVVRNSCEHRSMNVKSASSHISYVIFWFLSRSIRITLLDVVDALIFVGVLAYILIRRFVYAISLVERWLVLSPLHFAYLLIYLFHSYETDEHRQNDSFIQCSFFPVFSCCFFSRSICFSRLFFVFHVYYVFFWFISSILTRLINTIVMLVFSRPKYYYILHIILYHLHALNSWGCDGMVGWLSGL